jgi:hypothetical protein
MAGKANKWRVLRETFCERNISQIRLADLLARGEGYLRVLENILRFTDHVANECCVDGPYPESIAIWNPVQFVRFFDLRLKGDASRPKRRVPHAQQTMEDSPAVQGSGNGALLLQMPLTSVQQRLSPSCALFSCASSFISLFDRRRGYPFSDQSLAQHRGHGSSGEGPSIGHEVGF